MEAKSPDWKSGMIVSVAETCRCITYAPGGTARDGVKKTKRRPDLEAQ
jgi:hypothetical protein